ncbi:MAG: hypothetical protein NXI31_12545 [bacterium]|nr:hypothetical protein [bacterium]
MPTKHSRSTFATVLALTTAGLAQVTVERLSDFEPRFAPAVAFEPQSGHGMLFGGFTGVPRQWRNDCYRHVDGVWQRVISATTPPALVDPHAASWPGQGMLVCGSGATWLFDGTNWQSIATNAVPANPLAMSHDPVRNEVVALAVGSPTTASTTWTFDGLDWTQRTPSLNPPAVSYSKMAWDPSTQTSALMITNGGNGFGQFAWDGTDWNQVSFSSIGPTNFALATAPNQAGVIRSGGFTQPFSIGGNDLYSGNGNVALQGPGAPPHRLASVGWYEPGPDRTVIAHPSRTNHGVWYWDGASWSQPAPGRHLPIGSPAVYDSWRGRVLTFGGAWLGSYEHDELWQRQNGIATLLGTGGPLPRQAHGVAFDSWRGELVTFGGADVDPGSGSYLPLLDGYATQAWNGASWRSTPWTASSPSFRAFPAMAFDASRGRVVLFGGRSITFSNTWLNDTHEWDGTSWARLTPTVQPPAAQYPQLFYDPERGQCVLHESNGFWRFDGNDWLNLGIPALIAPSHQAEVGFDRSRDRWLATTVRDGIFELQANQWMLVNPVSVPSPSGTMTFDSSRGEFVGFDHTGPYTIRTQGAGTLRPLGNGCGGQAGEPVLHGERPLRLGASRPLHLDRAPAGAFWLAVFGSDVPTYQGVPLPIDLSPFGAPGCALHTEAAGTTVRTGRDWPLAIPANPGLQGTAMRFQALVFDATANSLGLSASNGIVATVGQ